MFAVEYIESILIQMCYEKMLFTYCLISVEVLNNTISYLPSFSLPGSYICHIHVLG